MKVHEIREGTWPSGDAYVEVCCKVEDGNWLNARIKPTLLEIGRVYVACGLDRPTGDAFDESDLIGCSCRALLKIRRYQTRDGEEREVYELDQWLKPVAGGEVNQSRASAVKQQPKPKPQPVAAEDDDIPF